MNFISEKTVDIKDLSPEEQEEWRRLAAAFKAKDEEHEQRVRPVRTAIERILGTCLNADPDVRLFKIECSVGPDIDVTLDHLTTLSEVFHTRKITIRCGGVRDYDDADDTMIIIEDWRLCQ